MEEFAKHVRSMSKEEFKKELDKLEDDELTKTIHYAYDSNMGS